MTTVHDLKAFDLSLELPAPYLLFLGDANDATFLKTALGLRDWAPELCIGQYRCKGAGADIGLKDMSPQEAHAIGARALVIGVASIGGALKAGWLDDLVDALEAGLDIVSGAHDQLSAEPRLVEAANRMGRRLIDVRYPAVRLPIATGRKRIGKRLLTVGTDCALGKKYTALSLVRAFRARGIDADFRASGQTGVMIAGRGIAIDSVVADFIAGAAEILSPDADPDHWDVVEGQGSIFHPSYAGVSLGLMHGSQPDVIVMCHEAGRSQIVGLPDYPVPDLNVAVELTLRLAALTNANVRCGGISLNTSGLAAEEAMAAIALCAARTGLPVADPMRPGPAFDRLVDNCLD